MASRFGVGGRVILHTHTQGVKSLKHTCQEVEWPGYGDLSTGLISDHCATDDLDRYSNEIWIPFRRPRQRNISANCRLSLLKFRTTIIRRRRVRGVCWGVAQT